MFSPSWYMHSFEIPARRITTCQKAHAKFKYKELVIDYAAFRSAAKRTSTQLHPAVREVLAAVDLEIHDAKQQFEETPCTCDANESEASTLIRARDVASWASDDIANLVDVALTEVELGLDVDHES